MNFNVILAILQQKEIITEEEAIKVAQFVEQSPQSTYYKDALFAIQEIIPGPKVSPNQEVIGMEPAKIDLSSIKVADKKDESTSEAKKSTDKKT